MPRLARVVVPGLPHHITQRGNRSQPVFFSDDDRREYLKLILTHSRKQKVQIWAYCLMTNHVHFIAVPDSEKSLTATFQEAHRLYTRRINFREGWRGYLWQGRFSSFPMDEEYLIAAVRYVEQNPVKTKVSLNAWDYPWSSARTHCKIQTDPLLTPFFLQEQITDWKDFLSSEDVSINHKRIESSIRTGRPLGSMGFIQGLEDRLDRVLRKRKPGRKPVLVN